jgi:hypothetical protein
MRADGSGLGDGDRRGRLLRQRVEVTWVAGEDDGVGVREGDHDGVDGGDLGRLAGGGAQAGSFAGDGFTDVADLAGAQAVGVVVAAVVTGEGFGQDDGGDLRWPEPAAAQLDQAGSVSGQGTDAAGVQDQGSCRLGLPARAAASWGRCVR